MGWPSCNTGCTPLSYTSVETGGIQHCNYVCGIAIYVVYELNIRYDNSGPDMIFPSQVNIY